MYRLSEPNDSQQSACMKKSPDHQMHKPFKTSSWTYGEPRFVLVMETCFAVICRQLGREAEAKKLRGWQSVHYYYWTEIDKKIQKEKSACKKLLKSGDFHLQCKTDRAMSRAYDWIGFNMGDMISGLSTIVQYETSFYTPTSFPWSSTVAMMIWRKGFIAIFLTSLWSFLFVEEAQLGLMLKLLEKK